MAITAAVVKLESMNAKKPEEIVNDARRKHLIVGVTTLSSY